MAEVSVTVKFTPAEYDLLRKSLNDRMLSAKHEREYNPDAKERAQARELEARLGLLLSKL